MRRRFFPLAIGATTLGVATAAGLMTMGAFASPVATAGPDLSMTGSVVAGVRAADTYQLVPFSFTAHNKSSTASADLSFDFTVTNGSDTAYVCPLVASHNDINPDTPSCEVGTLGAGKSSSAAIIVTPAGASGQTVRVRACASNLSGAVDPVASNNCKTLTIKIE